MPIAFSVRNNFSSAAYRDTFLRLLAAPDVTSVHVASGFFSNFFLKQNSAAPDFSLSEALRGKSIFLLGAYNNSRAKKSLVDLRDLLREHEINAHAYLIPTKTHRRNPTYRWHAKIAVFDGEEGPFAAITGSSNFTFPSLMGPSEHKYKTNPGIINIESDVFLWRSSKIDIAQAMHDAFNYWGRTNTGKVAFDDLKYDDEVGSLIQYLYNAILALNWERLP